MLETVREYGLEQLAASGESELPVAARRLLPGGHRAGRREWTGPRHLAATLEADHDNLRAAFAWLIEAGDIKRAQRLAAALWLFWWLRGH